MTADTSTISVLIVDDSPIVRYGIRAALRHEPTGEAVEIVGEAASAIEALQEAMRLRPDVVLLDLRLPDDTGVNVCRRLRELLPAACVIILTSSSDSQSIYEAILAGAQGYLLKEVNAAVLTRAILDGHARRPVISEAVSSGVVTLIRESGGQPVAAPALSHLSRQQREVLALISAGQTNKEIAAAMGLSLNTVKNYIAIIFKKMGLTHRSQAVAKYLNSQPRN